MSGLAGRERAHSRRESSQLPAMGPQALQPGTLDPLPRPRTLIHPGRFNPVRIRSLHSDRARHFRLALQPGLSLFEALVRPLAEADVRNASTTILGGWFRSFRYCVAPLDPTGRTVVAYSDPREAGQACMVFGNATLGVNVQGQPLVHCHATFCTEAGEVRGGHVLTEHCTVGADPIAVLITALDGFELRQAYDPETNMQLLQPHEVATNE